MNTARIAENIKMTILEFVNDLKDGIFTEPSDQGELLIVEFAFSKMNNSTIAEHVVSRILPHKENIKNRKIQFFVDNQGEIFRGLPKDRVEYFSNLIGRAPDEGGLADDDKIAIWKYFDTLILLAEAYKKKK